MQSNDPHSREQREEARRILDRVETDNTSFITGTFGRVSDHFSARDAEPQDKAAVWATRIGRALGLVAFVVLVLNLFTRWFF